MEMEKIPIAGDKIEGIDIAGFNRSSLIKNIGLPVKLVKSFFQVRKIIGQFQPDAVVGVGGYSSFPVLRYAQSKRIPTFIHESNSFAGKSNILLGKKATRVFVAGTGMEKFFPAGRIQVTGNPVRTSIAESRVTREEGIRFFGLDPAKQTVLSVGGSLGARSINEAIDRRLEDFEANGLQLIWQTGKPYAEKGRQRAGGKTNVWVNDFIAQMEYAYAAADLVISRSGAMAIAELAMMQKPVVFVPYPHAAEDHQAANAQNLVNKQAAIMVKDGEALDKLVETVIALSKDEARKEELKRNIAGFAVKDAGKMIAREIFKLLP